jgi:hypothetical protein
MARIFFAWELGNHFGHLTRLLPLAIALREAGHECRFAVRNLGSAAGVLTPHQFEYFQAPVLTFRSLLPGTPASYAEKLLSLGYLDPHKLLGGVQAWTNLIASTNADIVVADYAPTAILASYILGVKSIRFGNGFENPPTSNAGLSTALFETADFVRGNASERRLAAAVNVVLSAFGIRQIGTFDDIVEGSPLSLATFSELDHYSRGDGNYVGHISMDVSHFCTKWDEAAPMRILAYLRQDMPGKDRLVRYLKRTAADTVIVIPDAIDRRTIKLQEDARTFERPIAMSNLVPRADAVVSYGGAGLVAEALLAGVPLFLFPQTTEQKITAERVRALGAGVVIREADVEQEGIERALDEFIQCKYEYRRGALNFRRKYERFSREAAIMSLVRMVEAFAKHDIVPRKPTTAPRAVGSSGARSAGFQ